MPLCLGHGVVGIGVLPIMGEAFVVDFAVRSSYAISHDACKSCTLLILARNNNT